MTDEMIVDLFWDRSERAIEETEKKYGGYCNTVAFNVLGNREDAEECVNDTYVSAWESIPPSRPARLSLFLGKITRNIALNKFGYYSAEKRGGAQAALALDELLECVSDTEGEAVDRLILKEVLDSFLAGLTKESRGIFVCRYWHLCSSKEIARRYGISENKVNVSLHRSRNALKLILEKEGLY